MAVSAGLLLTLAFVTLAIGTNVRDAIENDTAADAWQLARWPLGVAFLLGAYSLIFRFVPRRHQPAMSWLAFGAAVGVILTLAVSIALAVYLGASSNFGETYGPLAGFMGVLLWAYLSSIAVLLGMAFAAQLEEARAARLATARATAPLLPPQVVAG
jgi:YihY family inner membrane protein